MIKLLPPEFTSEVSAARFKQEIELAAHLQHPNILPVLTAGAKDDLLFDVMPFVSGESLGHRLTREGKLPVADAVRILYEIADALAYAHHPVRRTEMQHDALIAQGRLYAAASASRALQVEMHRAGCGRHSRELPALGPEGIELGVIEPGFLWWPANNVAVLPASRDIHEGRRDPPERRRLRLWFTGWDLRNTEDAEHSIAPGAVA